MAKVGGSYDSVVLGVSEQVATDRRQGQHEMQVNYISDPVRGLARRWGSVFQAEDHLFDGGISPALADEHARMREYSFTISGVDYCLLYRPFSTATGADHFCYLYNKTAGTFVPIVYQPGSGFLSSLISGGVSAVANVGRYLYIAGRTTTATVTQTNRWADVSNSIYKVVWVRGGAYARTYRARLLADDGVSFVEATYKTMSSGYDYDLDTNPSKPPVPVSPPSGASQTDIDKFQNDSLAWNNYYNKASSAHIVAAAQDITPENIADKLRLSFIAQGVTSVDRFGGTLVIAQGGYRDITTDDGGDGNTMLGVGQEVASVDRLSAMHAVGKVVRVRPRGAQQKEAFYVKAYAKNEGATGWQEVIWREAAGVEQTWTTMWAQAVIHGGTMYVAQDGPGLTAIAPGSGPHPGYKNSEVGDGASSPIPNFAGKTITLLSVFQDRLLVGAEGVVNASRPGDYLNFFRQSVLDIRDDDPVEMYAYGAEGDVLRGSALFDKDLVIFGDQKQYAISGRAILTPRNPNIAVMSSHEDSTQAYPAASGNLMFYGKQREGRTSMHQIQVGQLTESPESIEISAQLDTFLQGRPAQIVPLTSPNTLVFRTEARQFSLYVYNYIDTAAGSERVFDSWSRWDYHEFLGTIAGVSAHKGELLLFTLRFASGSVYIVCDKQSLSTDISPRPYMDSLKLYPSAGGSHSAIPIDETDDWSVAIGQGHVSFLFGDTMSGAANLLTQIPDAGPYLWQGLHTDAYVTPTNPFVRDRNGKAVVEGRLTLGHMAISVAKTAAFEVDVTTRNGTKTWTDFIGRVMGDHFNVIGEQPIITDKVIVGIGAETRECTYTIRSRQWMPVTITAISWTGQLFNRVRRVS